MKSKKANALLISLVVIASIGFLFSVGYLISNSSSTDTLDEETDSNSYLAQLTDQNQESANYIPTASFGGSSSSSDDNTDPGEIEDLLVKSRGTTWIFWDWTNPDDDDFEKSLVYIDGVKVSTTSSSYYNATGLNPGTSYTIEVKTRDYDGNINDDEVSDTASTLAGSTDLIPPASITNLTSLANSTDWIYWNWTNPGDADFYQNLVYVTSLTDNHYTTTSNSYINMTGLLPNTNYVITVYTEDINGNINSTVVNHAEITLPDTIAPNTITNLMIVERNLSWITWDWSNPTNSDFYEAMVSIDGVNVANTSSNQYNATGLSQNAAHTISITTIDTSGNINDTAITSSANTCRLIEWFEPYVVCN